MPSAKPCLGYPSRTDAVLGLRKRGLTDREIARQIGIDVSTVSALAASAQRKLSRHEGHTADLIQTGIILPQLTRIALRKAAAARSISVDRLAILLVETIVDADIIDAVLDDGFREELR